MRLGLAGLLLTLSLVAVACGGSDDGGFFKGGREPMPDQGGCGVAGCTALTPRAGGDAGLPSGNASAAPDPCKLLTRDEALALLKVKDFSEAKEVTVPGNVMGTRGCRYLSSDGTAITLDVIATAGMGDAVRRNGYNAKRQYEELKSLNKNPVNVPGIGDGAWIDGRMIHVLKKDVTFDLTVAVNGDPAPVLRQAATQIAAKLP